MGTNYYAVRILNEIEKENAKKMIENDQYGELKEFLDEKTREIHIGKSSIGWKFLFNWNKEKYYKPLKHSINDFLSLYRIVDEYGKEISLESFWEMVEKKSNGMDNEEYYSKYEKGKIFDDEIYYNEELAKYNPKFYEFYSDGLRFSTINDFC